MLKKILAAWAALSSAASIVMLVLLKMFKADNQKIQAENKAEQAEKRADAEAAARKAEAAVARKKAETEAEDEKLNERVHSGDSLDSFDAGLDMLRRQSERGNKRNTGAGDTRA